MTITSPQIPSSTARPGPSAVAELLTALLVGLVVFLRPLLETLSTLTIGGAGDPRYLLSILGVRGPVLIAFAVTVALVVLVGLLVAPVRATLSMGQVVGRGVAISAAALVIAVPVTVVVSLLGGIAAIGREPRDGVLVALLRELRGALLPATVSQVGANLDLLVIVPFAALLLWGWARSRPV